MLRLQRAEEESDIKAAGDRNLALRSDLMELKRQQTEQSEQYEKAKAEKASNNDTIVSLCRK
jgi:hypothetical protein